MNDRPAYEAHLARGRLLRGTGRNAEACTALGSAIEADPDRPEAYLELALAKSEFPGKQVDSLGAIERAISIEPTSATYLGTKAFLLAIFDRPVDALAFYKRALELNPTCHIALVAQANAYTKLKDWLGAERAARQVLEIYPADIDGLNLLAQSLRNQDRIKECRVVIAQIFALTPNNAFGHGNAGFAAIKAGDPLRARQHFLQALRIEPESDFARIGLLQSLRERNWIYRINRKILIWFSNDSKLRKFIFAMLALMTGGIFVAMLFLYLIVAVTLQPLSNFFLLFNPIGRRSLDQKERVRALTTGLGAILILGLLLFTKLVGLVVLYGVYLLLFSLFVFIPMIIDSVLQRWDEAGNRP